MRLGPPPEQEEEPGQFWKDFIRDTSPVFRKPTIEQLEGFIQPTWQALVDGAKYVEPRLRELLDGIEPDVVVQDNVVGFAALPTYGRPWVRIVSCNPCEVKDPDIPPTFSGYSAADRAGWEEFRAEYDARQPAPLGGLRRVHARAGRSAAPRARVRPRVAVAEPLPLPRGSGLPAITAARPELAPPGRLRARHRRRVDRAGGLPRRREARVPEPRQSRLGGCRADAPARRRARREPAPVRGLEGSAARALRAGRQHDRRRVPAADRSCPRSTSWSRTAATTRSPRACSSASRWSCCRSSGTSTTTRSACTRSGYGARLDDVRHEPDELRGAIDRLLADEVLRERMRRISARLQADPGTAKAAGLIERVADTAERLA